MIKMINKSEPKICDYCKENPGPHPSNPLLWFGFLDKETEQLVCWHCRNKHYKIKSASGTKDFSIVEYPVPL